MRKLLKTSDRVGVAVFGLEHKGSLERFDDAALTGNPEFGREIGMNAGDDLHAGKGTFFWNGYCVFNLFVFLRN